MNHHSQTRMPKQVTYVLLALLMAFFLTGARCERRANQSGGSSANVKVIPGSGVTGWQGTNPATGEMLTLFNLINQRRASRGRPALTWHHGAASVAQRHANDMISRSYFGGVSPDGIGIDNRLVSSTPRIDFTRWGAILNQGSMYAGYILQSDIDAGYGSIIESGSFTHIGIGFNPNKGGTWVEIYLQNPRP